MESHDLLDVFAARSGVVCIVGAGGKKTTLFRLVSRHPGRLAITTTVHTPPYRARLGAHVVIAPEAELREKVIAASREHRRIAYGQPSEKAARVKGVTPACLSALHREAGFDVTLVKADGARLRWAKAPAEDEPCVPDSYQTLISVVSARALDMPLSGEVVHRPARFAAIAGMCENEPIRPVHLARLLASDAGGVKGADDATVVALINMVETREQERLARAIAEQAMELNDGIRRIVIAAMVRDDPLIDVIEGVGA
jgi:probable selenium-dependent hydroxylase accessory protein YqeC